MATRFLHRHKDRPFKVTDVPGLLSWFDAQAIRDGTDASTYGTWQDRLRNQNMSEATNPPTYRSAGFGSFASLDFDGTNDELSGTTTYPQLSGQTNLWIFAAVTLDTATTFRGIVNKDDNVATTSRGFNAFIAQTSGAPAFIIPTSASARVRRDALTPITAKGPVILTFGFKGSTEMSIYLNGLNDNSTIDAAIPASIGNNGGTFRIGRTDAGEYWDGDIAEIIISKGDLTANNWLWRRRIERYLSLKYDIPILSSVFRSPDINAHQGYCWTGSQHILTDTAEVRKRDDDASWTSSTVNSSPFTDTSSDHLGGCDYYGGKIFAAMEQYSSCASKSDQGIAVFDDAAGLPRDSFTNLPTNGGANDHEAAGLVVVPEHGANGKIYMVSYCDGTKIRVYSVTTLVPLDGLTYDGAITLSTSLGSNPGPQDITYLDGFFYVVTDTKVHKVSQAGDVETVLDWDGVFSGVGVFEGIDVVDGTLRLLIDHGTNEYVRYLELPPSMSKRTARAVNVVEAAAPPAVNRRRRFLIGAA